ncbi:MAG TPA: beta-ketoacyl-[acyl-carrier-protein] synthase family protein [Thermoanaerobaculia bacterium]|jgi:3-oxoacyl-[acyl-carrier-protein] synthase II|nr:beta-ketoacyl-[acyl-carrier-protein] synthase family protein [Thermoanaerobaculia bacterium]
MAADVRRVVVTGMGVITPLGNDPETLFGRLMEGESAIREVTTEGPKGPSSNVAGPAAFNPEHYFPPQQKLDHIDRVARFSLASAAMAIRDSGIAFTEQLRERTGVSFGTGMGAANALEETFAQLLVRDANRVKPLTVLKVMNNAPAALIAIEHALGGPDLTYSCACSSSSVSIGEAYRQIRHGYADAMIAGGAEAPLTFGFFKSWEAMHILAVPDRENPSASCRPFSRNRTGLVLGEGAAMIVLEEREMALQRHARIYGEIAGYGSSNDHRHITKPSVEGQAQAMRLALAEANLSTGDVNYINAHGTATVLNDVTETRAIKSVFGERAYAIPVSSTKSMHGHLLGGAGALEFVISLLAMGHNAVPPTANLSVPDPECDLDYVPGRGRAGQDIRCVMSNSFAFGGTNAVLLARRE